jgi:hypothetical protein
MSYACLELRTPEMSSYRFCLAVSGAAFRSGALVEAG